MRKTLRRVVLSGALVTVGGLLLAIVALPPGAWVESLSQWASLLRPYAPYALGGIAGLLVGAVVSRLGGARSTLEVLQEPDFLQAVRRDINSRAFEVVKVFGYTGEVVGNDIIKYEDRYRADLEVRFLHRDWLIEKNDEEAHNARATRAGRRPWDKAMAIREAGTADWPHALRRSVRYYQHQPMVKAVLMCDGSGHALAAYFTFQKWEPDPGQGGSQFKSVPTTMAHASVDEGPWQRQLVERLNSQFEYEWLHGETSADILDRESAASDPRALRKAK